MNIITTPVGNGEYKNYTQQHLYAMPSGTLRIAKPLAAEIFEEITNVDLTKLIE